MTVLTLLPVVQENVVVVHMAVATDTDSAEPKPVTVIAGVIASCGKPKLLPVYDTDTFGVMVSVAVPVLVPSDTVTVCAPPGRFGTFALMAKLPTAVVVKHPPTMRLAGVDVPLLPLLVVVQAPIVFSHGTVVLPTVVMMVIAVAGAKPKPSMVKVVPTVADGAAVSTPLLSVDRVTVGPAACAVLYGSRKTIPAIPARNSSPIVPNEASLLFGVNCICILFTYFRNFWVPNYDI